MESVHEFQGSVDVGSDYASTETIWKRVGSCDDFFLVAPLEDAHDWAENLLLSDSHVVLHIYKNGGLNKEALFSVPAASEDHLSAFFFALFNVHQDSFELFLANNSSLSGFFIQWVPNNDFLCNCDALLDEFIVD